MPTVSVIISTYNRSHVLGRSIQSVLNQTFQDFELIIVDDGSTDDTEKIVSNLSNEKVKYVRHQKNRGASVARNIGIRLAKGDYIAILDDDDEWMPEILEKQMKVFYTAPPEVGAVYTKYKKYDSLGEYVPPLKVAKKEGDLFKQLLKEFYIQWQTALIKRECFDKVGLISESMLYSRDWDFLLRISQHYQFLYIDEPLAIIHEQPEGRLSKFEPFLADIQRILKMYFPQIKQDRKVLAIYYYRIAFWSCHLGKIGQGRYYYLKSLRAYPVDIIVISAFLASLFGCTTHNVLANLYRKRWKLFHKIRMAYLACARND